MKPNILIAVPAYGDVVRRGCVQSLLKLFAEFTKRHIDCGYKDMDLSDIPTMRNVFASFLVQEQSYTHLLFWDSDIAPEKPDTIIRMIAADKDVIACVCPRRKLDIEAALNHARNGDSNAVAISKASKFNMRVRRARKINAVVELDDPDDGIGTGLMLIKREALSAMIQSGKVRRQESHDFIGSGLSAPLYGFFDIVFVGSDAMTEDYSFCIRYRQLCDGQIFALPNEDIGHAGNFTYRAKITDL